MKKFLVVVFVLAVLAAGFFLGWAQLQVPVGSVAVVHSKTHGVDPVVIQSGEFRWLWYKLIPTNVEILVFAPRSRCGRTFTLSGELPQSQTLSRFAGLETGFSWEVSGSVAFDIKPEALPGLVETQGIRDDQTLAAFAEQTLGAIETLVKARLAAYVDAAASHAAEGGEAGRLTASRLEEAGKKLEAEIAQVHPEAGNIVLELSVTNEPDYDFYMIAAGMYGEYLERQRQILREALVSQADRQVAAQFQFDWLERYGELLQKYPVLLDLLLKGGIQIF